MANFCERFRDAWAAPTPESLGELLAEDVVLYQPHLPPIRGRQAAVAEFRRLFEWLPGTHSVTGRWQETEDAAFIEHVLHFPVGDQWIRLPSVDRFLLRDGLAVERTVYFDQTRLITSVLRHPSLWAGYARYRMQR